MCLRGNYSDDSEGGSYGQLVIGSFIMTMCLLMHHVSCRVFYHPGDSAPLQPTFGALWLLAFPKSKITFEREETVDEIQENTTGQLMAIGRTVWSPKVPTLKGTEVSLDWGVQCFLYFVSSLIKVSFILHGWIPFGQTWYVNISAGYVSRSYWIWLF